MEMDKKILNPMIQLFQPEVEEVIKNKRWREKILLIVGLGMRL